MRPPAGARTRRRWAAAFQNASQLVSGNNVNVAGVPVGSIKKQLIQGGTLDCDPDMVPIGP